jgi:hypothetical protein
MSLRQLSEAELADLARAYQHVNAGCLSWRTTLIDMRKRGINEETQKDFAAERLLTSAAPLHELGSRLVELRDEMGEESLKRALNDSGAIPWKEAEILMNFALDSWYAREVQATIDRLKPVD